jgi:hypothetical protein
MRCAKPSLKRLVCAKEKKAMSKEKKIIAKLTLEKNQKIMMDSTIIDVYTRE